MQTLPQLSLWQSEPEKMYKSSQVVVGEMSQRPEIERKLSGDACQAAGGQVSVAVRTIQGTIQEQQQL